MGEFLSVQIGYMPTRCRISSEKRSTLSAFEANDRADPLLSSAPILLKHTSPLNISQQISALGRIFHVFSAREISVVGATVMGGKRRPKVK